MRRYQQTQAAVDFDADRAQRIRDDRDEDLDREAEALAERTLETADLARLIDTHEEWALLDCLLDAHRYGTDADAAWEHLRTGLLQSMTAQIRADLQKSRGLT